MLNEFALAILDMEPEQRIAFIEAMLEFSDKTKKVLFNLLRQINYLNQGERSRILTMVEGIEAEYDRCKALLDLNFEGRTDDESKQIVKTALSIKDADSRAPVLEKLFHELSKLPRESKSAVIEAATKINPALRAKVFSNVRIKKNELSEEERNKILAAATEIPDEGSQTLTLAKLAVQLVELPLQRRTELVSKALAIANEKDLARTISSLLLGMKSLVSGQLGELIFNKVHELNDEIFWVLERAANHVMYLDEKQICSLMNRTKRIQCESARAQVLRAWIAVMGQVSLYKNLVLEIIGAGLSITDEVQKSMVVRRLGLKLKDVPKDLRRKVIEAALDIADENMRTGALEGIAASADCLDEEEGKLFLQAVTGISGRNARARLFASTLEVIHPISSA